MCVQRLQHSADLEIHAIHHLLVGALGAAIKVADRRIAQPLRFSLIVLPFPRPMRRIEVHVQKERPSRLGVSLDSGDGPVADEVGHVAALLHRDVAVPKVGFVADACVVK